MLRRRFTAEMAVRLEKGLGSTAATWLAMQAAYDLARVKPVKVTRLKEAA
jgi:antitoxin HigA-1